MIGAAALMGITPTTAPALHAWLLKLAMGEVALEGSSAFVPAGTGVTKAIGML